MGFANNADWPPSSAVDGPVTAARLSVRVTGAVQGVGFRPFVRNLAKDCGLAGHVLNDEHGVLIEIEGVGTEAFLARLGTEAPPLSRIDSVQAEPSALAGETDFVIRPSAKGSAARTAITPDAAVCDSCLENMFNPDDRRWLYPFTNCTHCGPRYTITHSLPYDRSKTSMASFAMCGACDSEYTDPDDRRYHAQPNACPSCGPVLSMAPDEIFRRLRDGQILAVKGLGGYHLVCDARNGDAVHRLRQRKAREAKPFAVMVANLQSARQLATVGPVEAERLEDRARPIVLCDATPENGLAPGIHPGLNALGLMLPYTPIHYLIFHAAIGAPAGTEWLDEVQDLALVMTSANPGGEPLVIDECEAEARLSGIADAIVSHDRDIVVRCDDSVERMINGVPTYLRRARGATPDPIPLAYEVPPTLALGGHLKNTICITRGKEAFLSQHIGDLDNLATYGFAQEVTAHLLDILEVEPERVACDLHPDFLSTRYALETGLPLVQVQHHHAHLAAVAAEHQIDEPFVGLALDGFGLGDDGASSWGGELMRVDGHDFARLAGLSTLRQPGGDIAARSPWRMGAAALHALERDAEIVQRFGEQDGADLVGVMLERGVNAPETTSAGRLFDAACGLLGVQLNARFEGQAPMQLEALVQTPQILDGGWRITDDGALDFLPLLASLTDCDARTGAELFHGTLADGLAAWAIQAVNTHTPSARFVALSGGCLQNKLLAELLTTKLQAAGLRALLPVKAPANDGGLSLGQAWVAANTAL